MTKRVLLPVLLYGLPQFVYLRTWLLLRDSAASWAPQVFPDLAVLVATKMASEINIGALLAVLVVRDYVQPLALLQLADNHCFGAVAVAEFLKGACIERDALAPTKPIPQLPGALLPDNGHAKVGALGRGLLDLLHATITK
jgi:hypothetical protein